MRDLDRQLLYLKGFRKTNQKFFKSKVETMEVYSKNKVMIIYSKSTKKFFINTGVKLKSNFKYFSSVEEIIKNF